MGPTWIVAYDFSPFSALAARAAARDAPAFGARLVLVHAVDGGVLREEQDWETGEAAAISWEEYLERARASAVEELSATRDRLRERDPGLDVAVEVIEGHPVDAIEEACQRPEVTRLVLGSKGRTGLRRMVLGSVAEQLLRRVRVPTLVVKPTGEG